MELYFKEKLSLRGKFEITDAEGNVVSTGKKGFWSGIITLTDTEGNKLVSIIEYDSIFNKSFVIKQGKTKVAKMKKKLSLIGQKLHIKNLEWDVKGNFLAKEYTITKGEEAIAEIKKSKLLALTESYAITINNDENAANVVAVALILNQILKNKKGKLLKKAIGK